jgi:GTP-binding protein EngB required for normal cell division
MKTAMQELIEFIESTNNTPHVNLTIMDKAKKLLEKEKEQIIDAGNACSIKTIVHREKLDKMSEDELRSSLLEATDTISHGEQYYNQTYNQKNNL